jgi:hypothetical protein
MISFPNLPDVLTVRYNSAGLPEEIREKTRSFVCPSSVCWRGVSMRGWAAADGAPPADRRLYAVDRRHRRPVVFLAGAGESDHMTLVDRNILLSQSVLQTMATQFWGTNAVSEHHHPGLQRGTAAAAFAGQDRRVSCAPNPTQAKCWSSRMAPPTHTAASTVRSSPTRKCRRRPLLRLILLHSSPGKGAAVKHRDAAAQGEYRFICDADLAMPIAEIANFCRPAQARRISTSPLPAARRRAPCAYDEPAYRHIMGRVFNWLVRVLAVPGIQDTQCGFKMFTREAAQRSFPLQRLDGWSFRCRGALHRAPASPAPGRNAHQLVLPDATAACARCRTRSTWCASCSRSAATDGAGCMTARRPSQQE